MKIFKSRHSILALLFCLTFFMGCRKENVTPTEISKQNIPKDLQERIDKYRALLPKSIKIVDSITTIEYTDGRTITKIGNQDNKEMTFAVTANASVYKPFQQNKLANTVQKNEPITYNNGDNYIIRCFATYSAIPPTIMSVSNMYVQLDGAQNETYDDGQYMVTTNIEFIAPGHYPQPAPPCPWTYLWWKALVHHRRTWINKINNEIFTDSQDVEFSKAAKLTPYGLQ